MAKYVMMTVASIAYLVHIGAFFGGNADARKAARPVDEDRVAAEVHKMDPVLYAALRSLAEEHSDLDGSEAAAMLEKANPAYFRSCELTKLGSRQPLPPFLADVKAAAASGDEEVRELAEGLLRDTSEMSVEELRQTVDELAKQAEEFGIEMFPWEPAAFDDPYLTTEELRVLVVCGRVRLMKLLNQLS